MRKPETCFYSAIHDGAIPTRSKFDTPFTDVPLESRGSRLPASTLAADTTRRSLPFQEIVSTIAKCPYYSLGAYNYTVRDGDHAVRRDLRACKEEVADLWLGSLSQLEYLLIFKQPNSVGYQLALGHIEGGVVLGWFGDVIDVGLG